MTLNQAYTQIVARATQKGIDFKDVETFDICRLVEDTTAPRPGDNGVYNKMYKLFSNTSVAKCAPDFTLGKKRMGMLNKMEGKLLQRYSSLFPTHTQVEVKGSLISLFGISHGNPDLVNIVNTDQKIAEAIAVALITQVEKAGKTKELINLLQNWLLSNRWEDDVITAYVYNSIPGLFSISALREVIKKSSHESAHDGYLLFTGFDKTPSTKEQANAISCLSAIFSLIPQEIQEEAKALYNKAHWEMADVFFEYSLKVTQNLYRESMATRTAIMNAMSGKTPLFASENKETNDIINVFDCSRRLAEAFRSFVYINVYGNCVTAGSSINRGEHIEQASKKIKNIEYDDPGLVVLGMYLAFKSGEEYPWMLNISSTIATLVNQQHPINVSVPCNEFPEEYDIDALRYTNKPDIYSETRTHSSGRQFINSLVFTGKNEDMLTLPQFLLCARLPAPVFGIDLDDKTIDILKKSGLSEYEVGAVGVSRSFAFGNNLDNAVKDTLENKYAEEYAELMLDMDFDAEGESAETEETDERVAIDIDPSQLKEKDEIIKQLRAQISNKNIQITRLKERNDCAQEVVAASKAARDEAIAERDESIRKMAQMEKVIADLREDAFDIASGESGQEDLSDTIELPYTTQNNIIIFGGHESWLKEIKLMLPNVRFYGNQSFVNEDAIRGADGVYVQIKKICHSNWYKIMEICDRVGVPVKNFRFSSAKLCAQDVAKFDNELLEDEI